MKEEMMETAMMTIAVAKRSLEDRRMKVEGRGRRQQRKS